MSNDSGGGALRFKITTATVCGAVGVALAVSAIAAGASSASSRPHASSMGTVDVYSSLPLQGARRRQTVPLVNGIKLAL